MRRNGPMVFIMAIAYASAACAAPAETMLVESIQEARAQAIFSEFRCVVCQGESIADSPADIARDMRAEIRKQVSKNLSNDAIKSYFVTKYGEVILMQPLFSRHTALLWLAPALMLLAGAAILYRLMRRKATA